MKLFIENESVEKSIKWLNGQLRKHMNGEASDQMEARGVHYRLNYGVAIPHLKNIAEKLPVSYGLAERLWFSEVREMMLLAALIVPDKDMSVERCMEWSEKAYNNDIVERSAMFLWSRLPNIEQCIDRWITKGSDWEKAIALYTIGRVVQNEENPVQYKIEGILNIIEGHNSLIVMKSASFAIRMLLRSGIPVNNSLNKYVKQLNNADNINMRMLAQEINTEIEFLEDKN